MEYVIFLLVGYLLPMILCQLLICLNFYLDERSDTWGIKEDFKIMFYFSIVPAFNWFALVVLPFMILHTLVGKIQLIDKLYHKLVDIKKKNR